MIWWNLWCTQMCFYSIHYKTAWLTNKQKILKTVYTLRVIWTEPYIKDHCSYKTSWIGTVLVKMLIKTVQWTGFTKATCGNFYLSWEWTKLRKSTDVSSRAALHGTWPVFTGVLLVCARTYFACFCLSEDTCGVDRARVLVHEWNNILIIGFFFFRKPFQGSSRK